VFDPPEPQPTTAAKRNVATTEPRSIVLFLTVDMGESLVAPLRNGSPARAIRQRSLTLRRNPATRSIRGQRASRWELTAGKGTTRATFDFSSCVLAQVIQQFSDANAKTVQFDPCTLRYFNLERLSRVHTPPSWRSPLLRSQIKFLRARASCGPAQDSRLIRA